MCDIARQNKKMFAVEDGNVQTKVYHVKRVLPVVILYRLACVRASNLEGQYRRPRALDRNRKARELNGLPIELIRLATEIVL